MGYEWELWVQFHPGTLKGKKCAFPFPFSFPSFSLPACWVMDLVVSHLRQYIWGQHPTGGRATRQTESGSLNLVVVLNCLCPEQFMPKLYCIYFLVKSSSNPLWMIAIFQIFFTILLHIWHLWKFTKKCRGKINACLKTKTPNKTIETHSLEFSNIFNMYMEESTR